MGNRSSSGGGAPFGSHGAARSPNRDTEIARLNQNIQQLIDELKTADQDVNIVFSGPICIGVEEYCTQFAQEYTRNNFVFMEPIALLKDAGTAATPEQQKSKAKIFKHQFEMLDAQRKLAVDSVVRGEMNAPLLLHTLDLLRESYMHGMTADSGSEVVVMDEPVRTRTRSTAAFRVYHQNPDDVAVAQARASYAQRKLDKNALRALDLYGTLGWQLAEAHRPSAFTLYVYIHYKTAKYNEAYVAFLQSLRNSKRGNNALTFAQLADHARLSKQYMDQLYSKPVNAIVRNHFSVVANFEDRTLLDGLHGLVLCREILSLVRYLQEGAIWGAERDMRLQYLATSDWRVKRKFVIPAEMSLSTEAAAAKKSVVDSQRAVYPKPAIIQLLQPVSENNTPALARPGGGGGTATTNSCCSESSSSENAQHTSGDDYFDDLDINRATSELTLEVTPKQHHSLPHIRSGQATRTPVAVVLKPITQSRQGKQ